MDCIWDLPLLIARAEISTGQDEGVDKTNGIAEVSWYSPDERLEIFDQVQVFTTDTDDAVRNQLGVRYTPDTNCHQRGMEPGAHGHGPRNGEGSRPNTDGPATAKANTDEHG